MAINFVFRFQYRLASNVVYAIRHGFLNDISNIHRIIPRTCDIIYILLYPNSFYLFVFIHFYKFTRFHILHTFDIFLHILAYFYIYIYILHFILNIYIFIHIYIYTFTYSYIFFIFYYLLYFHTYFTPYTYPLHF